MAWIGYCRFLTGLMKPSELKIPSKSVHGRRIRLTLTSKLISIAGEDDLLEFSNTLKTQKFLKVADEKEDFSPF